MGTWCDESHVCDYDGVCCWDVGVYVLFFSGVWVCADVCCVSCVECVCFLSLDMGLCTIVVGVMDVVVLSDL